MKTNLNDFHTAWNWLRSHPAFFFKGKRGDEAVILSDKYGFLSALEIDVVKVNPMTNAIDDNKELNTATRTWLECGPWDDPENHNGIIWGEEEGVPTHDIDLDCGAPNFEDAIIKLAHLVRDKYGDHSNTED